MNLKELFVYILIMKKMSEKFKDEREAICHKIIGILELTNGEFILSELDENIEKQGAGYSLSTTSKTLLFPSICL